MSPTFRSLSIRNYRLFATGQIVSNTGTWMQRVAQDWLVLNLTHSSGTALGITTALQFLPMLMFSMWGGVLADRLSKRKLLMITQATMGVLALVLGIVTLAGVAQIWHVYTLAFLLGAVAAIDNPTRQAFVSEMVGPDQLANAVSLNSANFNFARILGPAVAGLLVAGIGTGWVFVLNAVSYGVVIGGLKLIRPRDLFPGPVVARKRGQLREGLRYVRSRPDLMVLLFVVFFVGTFGFNFQVTLALFARNVFHQGASSFGLLSAILAVGSLTGALYAARRRDVRMRLVLGAAVVFGVFEVLAGLMPGYVSFALMLIPNGIAALTFSTAANAAMQLRTTPEMRGRVMGLYMLVFLGGTPLGSPAIGWLAENWGPRWSLTIGGAVTAVAALAGVYAMYRVTRGRRPAVEVREIAVPQVAVVDDVLAGPGEPQPAAVRP